jgi:hypothetical protein
VIWIGFKTKKGPNVVLPTHCFPSLVSNKAKDFLANFKAPSEFPAENFCLERSRHLKASSLFMVYFVCSVKGGLIGGGVVVGSAKPFQMKFENPFQITTNGLMMLEELYE